MTSLKLQDAAALVAEYVARASLATAELALQRPCSLVQLKFGAAVGRSWPLAPAEPWVRLEVVSAGANAPLAEQLRTRRALLELVCQLAATPAARWAQSFEALWWPALLMPDGFSEDQFLEAAQAGGPAARFALSVGRPTLESVDMLFRFLRMDRRGLLTDEHWHLLQRLRVPPKKERQQVEISLRLANNVVDTAILRSMVDAMREFMSRTEESEDEDRYPRFEFEITSLWFDNCRFLNAAEDLVLLAQLVTLPSSTIRNLMLPGVFFNTLRNPAGLRSFQSFAKQVLAPSSPLRSLDLTRVGIDSNTMAVLCSALRYASPLTKLSVGYTIRGAHANFRLLWAWIFLAVFHIDSGCELEHFDISGLVLPAVGLDVLVAMLNSPHPGRAVVLLQDGRLPEGEGCEECALPPNERLFVRLLDGSQAWTSPGCSGAWPQLLPGTLQANDFDYEVMVRLVDWLCILIPGYGFGWAVRSAVKYEVTKLSHTVRVSEPQARPGLKSLTYRGAEEHSNGVVDLVSILGRSLICLDVPSCGLQSQDLDVILRVCPNLSRLNVISNLLGDLSPLLRAYEEGRCQKLAKVGVFVESVSPIVATQLQTILEHSSSKCLESLHLVAIARSDRIDNGDMVIWTKIRRVLSANTTLRSLHLSLLSGSCHEAATALVKPLHGQVLRYTTPIQLKTAFLSVVEQAPSSSSLCSLDHMVLSNIFSLAATSAVRRQVSIRR
ncbi:unnamed protein product [Phytophthora lilii]|uniref:Unnamed protein product n=1 Tax=Phytophthora lilii TaxID=2077276 RepID=A0A9W6WNE9_9STRA|nr:unnamed protein product [Phytophthora lilii]